MLVCLALALELRRPQQRFAEHPPYVLFRVKSVHHKRAPLLLHEEIEARWELEIIQVCPQHQPKLPTEPLHGYNVHRLDWEPKLHAVLDYLGGVPNFTILTAKVTTATLPQGRASTSRVGTDALYAWLSSGLSRLREDILGIGLREG